MITASPRETSDFMTAALSAYLAFSENYLPPTQRSAEIFRQPISRQIAESWAIFQSLKRQAMQHYWPESELNQRAFNEAFRLLKKADDECSPALEAFRLIDQPLKVISPMNWHGAAFYFLKSVPHDLSQHEQTIKLCQVSYFKFVGTLHKWTRLESDFLPREIVDRAEAGTKEYVELRLKCRRRDAELKEKATSIDDRIEILNSEFPTLNLDKDEIQKIGRIESNARNNAKKKKHSAK